MYRIMMESWGGTKKLFMDDLTEEEAVEICESYNWMVESINGGYIWDLVIERK